MFESTDAGSVPVNPEVESLGKVIEQSKENLANAEPVKKRGRGRPRKFAQKNPPEASQAAATPPPEIQTVPLAPIIAPCLQVGFQEIADRTKFADWAISQEQAEASAQALENLWNVYFPVTDLDPKTQAWLGVILTFGTVVGMKSLAYARHKSMERDVTPGATAPATPGAVAPYDAP